MSEKKENAVKNNPENAPEKATSRLPSWIKIKPAELEEIVVKLASEGNSPAKIGQILRDKHGIPKSKLLGRKITQILKERGIKYRSEEDILNEKISSLRSHVGKNKHDYSASRALTRRLWDLYHLRKA